MGWYGWILAIYLLSTFYFIYQHTTGVSWDFTVYVLNARYMFGGGSYFEVERAPLMPALVYLLSFMGYHIAEYLYIIVVSALFGFACVDFAGKAELNPPLFYALMLNPYVLNFGFLAGTELLTISLLTLAVTRLKSMWGAALLGLILLTRYTTASYLALIAYRKNMKEIFLGLAVVLLLSTPWLAYNLATRGHPFYSFVSAYFLNIMEKQAGFKGPAVGDLATSLLLYLPLICLGLYLRYSRGFRRLDAVMAAYTAITLLTFVITPTKELRYLFNIALPAVYYAALFVDRLVKGDRRRWLLILVAVVLMNYSASASFIKLKLPSGFSRGAAAVDGRCMVMSNAWPLLNHVGIPAHPHPRRGDVGLRVKSGYRIILYFDGDIPKPDYMYDREFLREHKILEWNRDYIILGNEFMCTEKERVDMSYIDYHNMGAGDVRLCPNVPLIC
jgi:hypothetical protein